MASEPFATRLSPEVKQALTDICRRYGLRKNFVVEQALREKLEDLLDTFELEAARQSATRFLPFEEVVADLRNRGKL